MKALQGRSAALALAGFTVATLAVIGCGLKVTSTDDTTPSPTTSPAVESPTPTPGPTPPSYNIIAEPASLKFGQVETSEFKTLQVGFLNKSSTVYTVKSIEIFQTIEYFSVSDVSGYTLEPGKNIVVDVTFRPGQTGNYKGSLAVIMEEGDVPAVSLTGVGIPYDPTNDSPTPSPTPGP